MTGLRQGRTRTGASFTLSPGGCRKDGIELVFGAFLQDQLRPRSALFNDATRALFFAPQHTNDGKAIAMMLGWHVGVVNGRRFFYKKGGGGGFHCMMRLHPDLAAGTVVMSNTTGLNVAA